MKGFNKISMQKKTSFKRCFPAIKILGKSFVNYYESWNEKKSLLLKYFYIVIYLNTEVEVIL